LLVDREVSPGGLSWSTLMLSREGAGRAKGTRSVRGFDSVAIGEGMLIYLNGHDQTLIPLLTFIRPGAPSPDGL